MTSWVSGDLDLRYSLASSVADYLCHHRQIGRRDREAGGPLFSRSPGKLCNIDEVSGPFLKDRRSRHGYIPHRPSVQANIHEKHRSGLHFAGTWHTHPSAHPKASFADIRSMFNLFTQSAHHLDAFLMVIVGTDVDPVTWELSVQGSFGRRVLLPSNSQAGRAFSHEGCACDHHSAKT